MTRHIHGLLKRGAILIALVLPFLLPTQGFAETITFVNETKTTLVVQLATVVRGSVRRAAPCTLGPGEKVNVVLSGNKMVNVYDAKMPNRTLYQGTIPASLLDGAYSLKQPDPRLPKVDLMIVKPGTLPR